MRTGLLAAIAILTAPALAQPAIGDRSPELGIEHLLNAPPGAEATLESLRGRLVVLEFWATWCGPCVGAIPHLNELHEAYKDRVVFISVTDEDRATVETFQEGEPPIANWIGIDADRSLFEAYRVRGIPATVVLDANGRFVARTSPHALTAERLDAYLSGERQQPAPTSDTPAARVHAAFADGAVSGTDPLTGVGLSPLTQFILRPTAVKDPALNIAVASGDHVTAMGMHRDGLICQFYGLPAAQIDLSALPPDERRYDLIVGGAFPPDLARRLTLEAFDAAEYRESRAVTTYRLVRAPGEIRNRAKPGRGVESHAEFKDDAVRVVNSRASTADLCQMVTGWLGLPCEDATGLSESFRIDVTYPRQMDADRARALLLEQVNLTLEEAISDLEVVVIRPRHPAD